MKNNAIVRRRITYVISADRIADRGSFVRIQSVPKFVCNKGCGVEVLIVRKVIVIETYGDL